MNTLLPIALSYSPLSMATTTQPDGSTVIVMDTLPPRWTSIDSSLWLLSAWRIDGGTVTETSISVKELFEFRRIFDADPFADVWLPLWRAPDTR